jgi:hypothetical protein
VNLLIILIDILVNFVLGIHQFPLHLSPLLGVAVIWRGDGAFRSFFIFFFVPLYISEAQFWLGFLITSSLSV